jgi:hypothetical protein
VRLRGEVEDGVNLVLSKSALDVRWRCDISVLERKIWLVIEDARVVEGGAIVELVEGHDIVVLGICEDQVAHEPTSSTYVLPFQSHTTSILLALVSLPVN